MQIRREELSQKMFYCSIHICHLTCNFGYFLLENIQREYTNLFKFRFLGFSFLFLKIIRSSQKTIWSIHHYNYYYDVILSIKGLKTLEVTFSKLSDENFGKIIKKKIGSRVLYVGSKVSGLTESWVPVSL